MQGSVWSGFAIDGRRYRLVVRVKEQLCLYSDTDETSQERKNKMIKMYSQKKINQIKYRIVQKLHVNVDGPNTGYKESHPDG